MITHRHLTPFDGRHQHHTSLNHSEIVQQPRRFACDRCRMQKLRCERDMWRPTLRPCKRCRKALIPCTISSLDAPGRKKSKGEPVTSKRPKKSSSSGRNAALRTPEKSSPTKDFMQSSTSDTWGFYNEAIPEANTMMDPVLQPVQYGLVNNGFVYHPMPSFSGLITPPSMENEQEHQASTQTLPSTNPLQHGWASANNDHHKSNDSLELNEEIPCLDNKEQLWDQENLRRLLDMNLQLLNCQSWVAQELTMLGTRDATVAFNKLESAASDVLRYSEQFLQVVDFFINGKLPSTTVTTNALIGDPFVSQVPTPFNSRRPSYVQQTAASAVEVTTAHVIQGGCITMPSENMFAPSYVSSPPCQSMWMGTPFEDVRVSLILAAINCYSCLAGSYHIIFSYLIHELLALHSPEAQSQSSPTFSGFDTTVETSPQLLHQGKESKLRLIFHNCISMLAHLEWTLGMPDEHCVALGSFSFLGVRRSHHVDGILSGPVAESLFGTLVNQSFGLCVNGLATGKNAMRELISAINGVLDASQAAAQTTAMTEK